MDAVQVFGPWIGGLAGVAALIVAVRTASAQSRKLEADADVGEAVADKTREETRRLVDAAIAEETTAREARMKRLEARIEALEVENVDLKMRLATLTRDKAADEAEIVRLREEITRRDDRIRKLEARIEILEHEAANRRDTDAAGLG